MANGIFKCDVLRIYPSDLDKILYRHRLGDEERSGVSPCLLLLCAQSCCMTGFDHLREMGEAPRGECLVRAGNERSVSITIWSV